MAGRGVPPVRVLVDLRGLRRAGGDAAFARRTRPPPSTPTGRRSWRSSTRCRTTSGRGACSRSACATSTPPAPTRTASSAKITHPKSTSSRARSRRPPAAPQLPDLRRGLSDAGRHLPARLHPRHRPGRSAHVRRAAPSRVGRRVRDVQPRHRAAVVGAGDRGGGGAGDRAAGRLAGRRPGAPATRPSSTRRRHGPAQDLGWVPARPDIDTIVADAWRWFTRPTLAVRSPAADDPLNAGDVTAFLPAARVRPALSRAAGRRRRGDDRLRHRLGGHRLSHQADLRRGAAHRPSRSAALPRLILGLYFCKGVGAYLSAYLMTDVGQRVVRDLRNVLFRHILAPVGGVLLQPDHRPADVAHHQRRGADPERRVGDASAI